ncbi:MAG: hypothetical protein JRI25_21455 [Deltaproteobacteria bacterium]|nr:hypothetical protein [Deltaproteobacteria bacterium]
MAPLASGDKKHACIHTSHFNHVRLITALALVDAPLAPAYIVLMDKRCNAIIIRARTPKGGSAGMGPPRRCRNELLGKGEYCATHQPQAEMQDLLQQCFRPRWEYTVKRWERQRERERRRAELAARYTW